MNELSNETEFKMVTGWAGISKELCKTTTVENFKNSNIYQGMEYILRGSGLSYGDESFNSQGYTLFDKRPKEFVLNSDLTVTTNANSTLFELLEFLVESNRTLRILPGTSQATIAGCIANDVHGKNHFKHGSFSKQLVNFTLINLNKNLEYFCSEASNEDLFKITPGSCGLTGWIKTATLETIELKNQLKVDTFYPESFSDLMKKMSMNSTNYDYQIGFINFMARKNRFKLLSANSISSQKKFKLAQPKNLLPIRFPFINFLTIRLRSIVQIAFEKLKPGSFVIDSFRFQFMADVHKNANKWFGSKGFIEYQFALDKNNFKLAYDILSELSLIADIYLSGVKLLGEKSNGPLSFPVKGATFTATVKPTKIVLEKLLVFDEMITSVGGKVYLAKDHRLNAENFRKMYPEVLKLESLRVKYDLTKIKSNLSKRLEIK